MPTLSGRQMLSNTLSSSWGMVGAPAQNHCAQLFFLLMTAGASTMQVQCGRREHSQETLKNIAAKLALQAHRWSGHTPPSCCCAARPRRPRRPPRCRWPGPPQTATPGTRALLGVEEGRALLAAAAFWHPSISAAVAATPPSALPGSTGSTPLLRRPLLHSTFQP